MAINPPHILSVLFFLLFTFTLNSASFPTNAEPYSLSSISARQLPPNRPFKLLLTRGVTPVPPFLSGYIDIDPATKTFIFNQTASSDTNLTFKLSPGPLEGELEVLSNGASSHVYLQQLVKSTTGGFRYLMSFSEHLPNKYEILYKNFTIQGQDCGGNCGGLGLTYNIGANSDIVDGFYVLPRQGKSGLWSVQWYFANATQGASLPAGALPVFLFVQWQ